MEDLKVETLKQLCADLKVAYGTDPSELAVSFREQGGDPLTHVLVVPIGERAKWPTASPEWVRFAPTRYPYIVRRLPEQSLLRDMRLAPTPWKHIFPMELRQEPMMDLAAGSEPVQNHTQEDRDGAD